MWGFSNQLQAKDEYDDEIFDDSDFYQQLLKEFIATGASGGTILPNLFVFIMLRWKSNGILARNFRHKEDKNEK